MGAVWSLEDVNLFNAMDKLKLIALLIACLKTVALQEEQQCKPSLRSKKYVRHCPKNEIEWFEEAIKKQCNLLTQTCVDTKDFQYHCLMDDRQKANVSVCAGVTLIYGYSCAKYNKKGSIGQIFYACEHSENPCPFKYYSNESFKYQDCYKFTNGGGELSTIFTNDVSSPEWYSGVTNIPNTTMDDVSTRSIRDSNIYEDALFPLAALTVVLVIGIVVYCTWFNIQKHRNRKSKSQAATHEEVKLV